MVIYLKFLPIFSYLIKLVLKITHYYLQNHHNVFQAKKLMEYYRIQIKLIQFQTHICIKYQTHINQNPLNKILEDMGINSIEISRIFLLRNQGTLLQLVICLNFLFTHYFHLIT